MRRHEDPRDPPEHPERRKALSCLAAWTGAAVVWTVVGGVPRAFAMGDPSRSSAVPASGLPSSGFGFVQISDTHIGFNKAANPDIVGTLRRAIADINALPQAPALVVHTGDVSHLSKPEQFGQARELFQELKV
ncbi:MAG TPA: metallophosphoesterase, partial [Xanthomonadaceae bacterium]|nr:metallophosphoesterase [Xanthomonadaceae bacterium]